MYSVTRNGEPKQFKHWKCQTCTAALVNGIMTEEQLIQTVTGGQVEVVRGTYVHRDLAPSIAMWCSAEFGLKLSRVINIFIAMKNKSNQLSKRQINELQEQCNLIAPNEIVTPNETKKQKSKKAAAAVRPKADKKTNVAATTVRETEKNVLLNFKTDYVLITRRYTNQINNSIQKCQAKYNTDLVEIHRVDTRIHSKKLITRFKDYVQKSDITHLFTFKRTGFVTDIEAEKVIEMFNEVIDKTVHVTEENTVAHEEGVVVEEVGVEEVVVEEVVVEHA